MRVRALSGSVALAAGLAVAGGAVAAPAYATCSPGARPCIEKVYMKDPTTLVFTWSDSASNGYQVRYHSTSDPGLLGSDIIPENQFEAFDTSWEIRGVVPGETYVLKVQGCQPEVQSVFDLSCGQWTGWDERSYTVPTPQDDPPKRLTLPKRPIGDEKSPYLDEKIDVPLVTAPEPDAPTATVAADVDVYNAKNEPDGAGQIVGILRQGNTVSLTGTCAAESWCEVSGDAVPGQKGWVWGHLTLP